MKIAVISVNPHFGLGGMEVFQKQLIKFLLKNNHNVTEYVIFDRKQKNHNGKIEDVNFSSIFVGDKNLHKPIKTQKLLFKLIDDETVDLIINNVAEVNHKKILNSKKTVFVQHGDWAKHEPSYKGRLDRVAMWINEKLFNIGCYCNTFNCAENVVFFTKFNNHGACKNPFYSPLPIPENISINLSKKIRENKAVWLARFSSIKGVDVLDEIAEKSELEIDVYGDGEDQPKSKKLKIHGKAERSKVAEIFGSHKVSLMTSKIEGFPFTIVESLSQGTPVIAFNNFDSLLFFQESGAVFCVEKGDVEGYVELMNRDIKVDLNKLSLFLKTLSIDEFESRWTKIINEITNKFKNK